ncbi:DVU0524 family FlgM-associated protein [Thermosulfuriphilus sp.]
MNIFNNHIQHVIRTYGRQMGRGFQALRRSDSAPKLDLVTITPEGKRRQLLDRLTNQIMERLLKGGGEIPQEALNEVALQEGLDVVSGKIKDGKFIFRLYHPEQGEVIKELDPEQMAEVAKRIAGRKLKELEEKKI